MMGRYRPKPDAYVQIFAPFFGLIQGVCDFLHFLLRKSAKKNVVSVRVVLVR